MRIKFMSVLIGILFIILFSSCSLKNNLSDKGETKSPEIETHKNNIVIPESADTIPVTRAMVAKMIALAFNDKNTIQNTDIEINFEDVDDMWYTPYINIAVLQGYMSGVDTKFLPDQPLSLTQAQLLLDKLNPSNKTRIKITDDIADKPISYALWVELYVKTLEDLSKDKNIEANYFIKTEDLIILTTPANNEAQKLWTTNTDKGEYNFTGLNIDSYIDCKIKAYTKDNELIAFIDVEEKNPTITNAYLTQLTDDYIQIFVGGVERTYMLGDLVIDRAQITTPIIDVKINQGSVLNLQPKTDKLNGRLLRADSAYIELAEYGKMSITDDIKVYSNLYDKLEWKSIKNIVSGTDIAEYILKDGKICAAIINKDFTPETIRIALRDSDFKNLTHKVVKLTSTTDYTLFYGNQTKHLKKGESFEITDEIFESTDRIYIKPNSTEGRIELQSITRNKSNPKYRGIIEVAKQNDEFIIVNEVSFEEYLYAVVPSEMPTNYGLEAAKAQAITARSYAFNQIFSNKYYKYGANVDDSTQSQVYNNIPENDNSIKAVNDTKGQVLTYKDAVISANFFSTASGSTANSGDVWMNTSTNKFPADTPIYLSSVKQYTDSDFGDLSQEENASKFYKNMNIDSYDSEFSWFRWYVTMTADEIANSINSSLKQRYNENKFAIKTLVDDNVYRSRDISTIGKLKDIQVLKRGEGGNIMELLIVGTDATIKVLTEYNIRVLLKPAKSSENANNITLYRKDGSKLVNYSLLPSAFFTFDKNIDENGNLKSVTFYGGGNGHGVGMSQNGAKVMADKGFDCNQILTYYYKDTEIKSLN